jgi:hypothetical protein
MTDRMGVLRISYIIKPSHSLREAVGRSPSELGELLLQTVLWNKDEGHRTIWKEDDGKAQVKLVFLASLKGDFADNPELCRLLGDFPLSLETFDKVLDHKTGR